MKHLIIGLILSLLTGCAANDSARLETNPPPKTVATPPPPETVTTNTPTETAALSTPSEPKTPPPRLPKLINHPRPNIQVELTPFLEASGCKTGKTPELEGCENLRAQMGCDKLIQPDALWGAVTPAYPMVLCLILPDSRRYPNSPDFASKLSEEIIKQIEKEGYFSRGQGRKRRYTRYVILQDGQFQLIKNIDELQKMFAPIESPQEALSYVLMATPFSAHTGQKINPAYRYYTDVIEDTHVVATKDGFEILLYTYRNFGCGSHPTSTIRVTLRLNGMISYPSQRIAYANPAEDNLCVD
ncbi:MAG: hypothetical protein DRR08_05305 [Candidatus Parabeggiatoa sp. nov. 2]|nr:MAG: hypothetical protein DRR08_05305 [Gammaproteobacteria bacterium]